MIYIAIEHNMIPDCPADLEVEDFEIIGVYDNRTKAGAAIELRKIETSAMDGTDPEAFGDEYPDKRFEIAYHEVR